ncbi:hypothetical protein AKJ49_00515 [candidate division MSBL1 archaeon SCGC-AAA382A03]|uniref:DUF2193 domain-containing protein n=1 Tax=candidate division MSBL1 archaeon SCGC-AAA382A03 TaxID=1698278 RepID=A0A133VGK5_9EURY|nr:hypothetical protein AKJ49_00515 [candidate division MSBL1 archaeon SCGC-AAA382A03]
MVTEKAVKETIGVKNVITDTILENRGGEFTIDDCQEFVDQVNTMEAGEGQEESVINLHVDSVNTHYNILNDLTETIAPKDDPFVEHYQTPPVLEILKEYDEDFKDSVETFIDAIAENKEIISREAVRIYGGVYGPTCVVDFALSPGSTANVVQRILRTTDIPEKHKEAILGLKGWGMNTSYGFADAFRHALEDGKTAAEAVEMEVEQMQKLYSDPVEAQAELMDDAGMDSFDQREYMERYKEEMKSSVEAAVDAGVHYANIAAVSAYCVGTIGHHIAQSTYNMYKDDMTAAILDAVRDVMVNTLNNGLDEGALDSPMTALTVARNSLAAGLAYVLSLDNFSVSQVIDLLTTRFHNMIANVRGDRGAADELHNVDFMDTLRSGAEYVPTHVSGYGPETKGVEIDLSPIDENETIQNPQRFTYPGCAITVRFSSLMRIADFPCMFTDEDVNATMMTNIIAQKPKTPFNPAKACKHCATVTPPLGRYQRTDECEWYKEL